MWTAASPISTQNWCPEWSDYCSGTIGSKADGGKRTKSESTLAEWERALANLGFGKLFTKKYLESVQNQLIKVSAKGMQKAGRRHRAMLMHLAALCEGFETPRL